MMESINVVIDDTIFEKGIDNNCEGQILKKNEDDDDMNNKLDKHYFLLLPLKNFFPKILPLSDQNGQRVTAGC